MDRTPPKDVCYWLPVADGGHWRFDVPADLAKCVGRYARIAEFAAHSRLLSCTAATSDGEA